MGQLRNIFKVCFFFVIYGKLIINWENGSVEITKPTPLVPFLLLLLSVETTLDQVRGFWGSCDTSIIKFRGSEPERLLGQEEGKATQRKTTTLSRVSVAVEQVTRWKHRAVIKVSGYMRDLLA